MSDFLEKLKKGMGIDDIPDNNKEEEPQKKVRKKMKNKNDMKRKILGFLKPTRFKIILTLILSIVLLIPILMGLSLFKLLFDLPVILSGYFILNSAHGAGVLTLTSTIVLLLTYLIEIYIISCFTVLVVKVIRDNRK